MTDGERDYFKSRGEKSDNLFTDASKKIEAKAPPVTNGKAETTPVADAMDDGEIIVEADGAIRDQKTGRFVPKSAFLRVKEEAKTAKGEAQTLRGNLIQARERLSILTEVLPKGEEQKAAVKAAPAAEPDPEQDIFAWVKWAKSQLSDLSGKVSKTAEDTQKERDRSNLQSFFTSDVASFSKENADFTDALNYGISARHKMLEAAGVTDEARRQGMVLSEIHDLIRESHGQKASVAKKLYGIAQALGYQKKAGAPGKDQSAEALAEIERINAAQKTNKTLGNGGGGAIGEAVTREKLSNMSDNDYSSARTAYIAKNGRAAWSDFLAGKR
jgi:hypothetical protein